MDRECRDKKSENLAPVEKARRRGAGSISINISVFRWYANSWREKLLLHTTKVVL
jgi:hypothetical protein